MLVLRGLDWNSWPGSGRPLGTATRLLSELSVVLVAVDAPGFLVLLCVDGLAILFCQVPIILRPHTALFLVDAGFLVFQAPGLACGEFSVLDAVCDPALLIGLALVNVIVMCARGRLWFGLSSPRAR